MAQAQLGQQALLVLVYLRKGEPFTEVGAGFDVSHDMLAVCHRNGRVAGPAGSETAGSVATGEAPQKMAYVIIDGAPITIDRVAADRPFYSGKYKRHR